MELNWNNDDYRLSIDGLLGVGFNMIMFMVISDEVVKEDKEYNEAAHACAVRVEFVFHGLDVNIYK